MENETDHFRKRVRKGLGSSHTSARCVMFSFFYKTKRITKFWKPSSRFVAGLAKRFATFARASGMFAAQQNAWILSKSSIADLAPRSNPARLDNRRARSWPSPSMFSKWLY